MSEKEIIIEVEELPINISTGDIYTIMQSNPNSYTHGMFKYPCKFIPEIPRWAIKKYASNKESIILDPFSGSGTTLLESIIMGYDSIGTEIDSIARLIIDVKSTSFDENEVEKLNSTYNELLKYCNNKNNPGIIPEISNINHWFPEENIEFLSRMRAYIDEIKNTKIKKFFQLVLATIIRNVSYADNQSPKPYVSSRVKKIPNHPQDEFKKIFKRYIDMSICFSKLNCSKKAEIISGNAMDIKTSLKVDLAVTSPPYINAFDYGRTLRLENLWLGFITEEELRAKKKDYVGTESIIKKDEAQNLDILEESSLLKSYFEELIKLDEKRAYIVKKFFQDMKINLIEVNKVLKNECRYIIVIGNSTIRSINIESWKVIKEISQYCDFDFELHYSYNIVNPYLRIPRKGRGGKINRDHILVLKKR